MNINTIIEKIQYKIKTESPYIFEECSDEKQTEIIETFYRIVLDEIELNKIRHELDITALTTVIREIKRSLPSYIKFDDTTSKRVYENVPIPTNKFILDKIKDKCKV